MNSNLGVKFIEVFRWLLVLLFTLLLEKGAEGITFRIGGEEPHPHYDVFRVFPPFGGNVEIWSGGSYLYSIMHWSYLTGILQFAITLLFAIRYFVCLVDPFERVTGMDVIESKCWQQKFTVKLTEIQSSRTFIAIVLLVTLISILEFLFLFHAATALRIYEQWLTFLIMLVFCDTFFFIGVFPLIPRCYACYDGVKRLRSAKKLKREKERLGRAIEMQAPWRSPGEFGNHGPDYWKPLLEKQELMLIEADNKAKELTNADAKMADERQKTLNDLKKTLGDYSPWNSLDLFILCFALMGYLFLNDGRTWMIWTLLASSVSFLSLADIWCDSGDAKLDTRMRWLIRSALLIVGLVGVLFALEVLSPVRFRDEYRDGYLFSLSLTVFAATAVVTWCNFMMHRSRWERHLFVLTI